MHRQPKRLSELLVCEDLAWETPGGRRVFNGLSVALGAEKTALVGDNGAGKTTLARILAGDLQPTTGVVRCMGRVAWLPQGVVYRVGESIAQILGVADRLDAIAAIEAGACDDELFERVGEQWDVAAKASAILDRLGLVGIELEGPVDRLSGGETMRVALAACLLAEPDFLLLDEPTNHLDTKARQALYAVLDSHRGGLLVISHDRALLRRMDRTLELSALGLRTYGGGWDAYQEQSAIEREAAQREADVAAGNLDRERRAMQAAKERQARREGSGRRGAQRRGASKIETRAAKQRAEKTTRRLGSGGTLRLSEAENALKAARATLRNASAARVELGDTAIPAGKVVVEAQGLNMRWDDGPWLWAEPGVDLSLVGPARLAIQGPSGCGKSTLARMLIGELKPGRGSVKLRESRFAWLDQRCGLLPDGMSLLDGMLQSNPELTTQEVYWSLDRVLLGREVASRRPDSLSGGERMRAALACLFGVGEPPRLLVLDEPTNNLDITTISVLESALAAYRGALILISHDPDFVQAVGVQQQIELH